MESIIELLKGWGGWVAAAIVSIFAIRGNINFDVNQWLKDRREVRREKAKMLCPHVSLTEGDQEKYIIRSQFFSRQGTTDWICELCGTVVSSQELVDEIHQHWVKNPKELVQRLKEYNKAAKKLI